ncbi:MAG: hypothetical protein R3A12_06655 [Ignavibacteria bacterium]
MSISELLRISINTLKANKLRIFYTFRNNHWSIFHHCDYDFAECFGAGIEGGLSELEVTPFRYRNSLLFRLEVREAALNTETDRYYIRTG